MILTDTSNRNYGIFTSKEIDPDTGLYCFNARWYDPTLGRFITEDPIKDGTNWHVYCNNNPINYIDPTGLKPDWYGGSESQWKEIVNKGGPQTGLDGNGDTGNGNDSSGDVPEFALDNGCNPEDADPVVNPADDSGDDSTVSNPPSEKKNSSNNSDNNNSPSAAQIEREKLEVLVDGVYIEPESYVTPKDTAMMIFTVGAASLEMTAGIVLLGTGNPLGLFLLTEGLSRGVLAGHKYNMKKDGVAPEYLNAIPDNIGGWVGKYFDSRNGVSFNEVGNGQKYGDWTNDLVTLGSSGASFITSVNSFYATAPTILKILGFSDDAIGITSGGLDIINNGKSNE